MCVICILRVTDWTVTMAHNLEIIKLDLHLTFVQDREPARNTWLSSYFANQAARFSWPKIHLGFHKADHTKEICAWSGKALPSYYNVNTQQLWYRTRFSWSCRIYTLHDHFQTYKSKWCIMGTSDGLMDRKVLDWGELLAQTVQI